MAQVETIKSTGAEASNIVEPVNPSQHADTNTQSSPPRLEPLEVEESSQNEERVYPTGVKLLSILLALGLSLILTSLDTAVIATAIPSITNHFKTIADVGWYSSGYRLTSCSFQFMFGKLYTVFSIKKVFLIAVCIFELGSLLCGIAPTSAALIFGRVISGLGAAGIISGVFTILAQTIPLRTRSFYAASFAAIEMISDIAGPLVGGVLTEKLSWRWCFYIILPMGAITFLFVLIFFDNPRVNADTSLPLKEKVSRLDLLSSAIFVPSVVCLLLALQWGGTKYGWTDVRIICLFVIFAILLGAFAWLQKRRQDRAILPPRIILRRSILAGMWFSFFNNAALNVFYFYLPIYFQAVKRVSAAKSGIMTIPMIGASMVAFVLGGSGVSLTGFYTPFMIATSLLTPISAGLFTTLKINAPPADSIGYQLLLGFGGALGFQAPQIAAQTILAQSDVPMGIAVVVFAQALGPALSVPLAQTIFTSRLASALENVNPPLNATALDSMGLSDLSKYISKEEIVSVLEGYDKSITQTFYLPLALTCLTLIGSLAMEWRSVKQKTN
ncbi:permease of the major facilitator superfamily [Xylona heveae TC161]|uniref:Permease of the major facilitator superfamily n=1 Tax=Xylona heveae (strain CBS 132557 / TC161) TaxID=1328760 RepID=A0A165IB35_XYLHT|nr:permease of the major facilitator superfamily [Xylona heveae TC161]KZF24651.1 permease of the major facilitator superfamily [Xylona heveae TC161]